MKRSVKSLLCLLICIFFLFAGCSTYTDTPVMETTEPETVAETETQEDEIIVSDEVESLAEDTSKAVEQGEDIATDEVIESGLDKEKELEPDAVVEQENISYNGTNTGNGLSLLGAYSGLTYYNQADSRWANQLYTSTGNQTQTMASSACGPTAAAMVVSSSKGAILPTTMANLFVDNGYRTASNGTAWAAFPFVADYFGFEEYCTTTSFSTMTKYLKKGYFVIASCNSGLWTTGGHYIVLVADNDGTITVYDPYLYSGKFNTASRRPANVRVSGNAAYVSESNFKKYSNAVQYWIFSNDAGKGAGTNTSNSVKYTRYVATQSAPLNVRSGAGTGYGIKSTLKKGTKVTVTKTSGAWSYITAPVTGWVSTEYLSSAPVATAPTVKTGTYTLNDICGVYKRNANGTFTRKKVRKLTANGRQNATSRSSSANAYLKKGTRVTVTSTLKDKDGNLWATIPSGYILIWHHNNGTLRMK